MAKKAQPSDALLKALREWGLKFPGAHTKSPWPGHLDLAVNDKTFAYLSVEGEPFSISCKLPKSAGAALALPFTSPTAYGLGKSGWVSAEFPQGQLPPLEMLQLWVDESYRAQAPKKCLKQLDGGEVAPAAKKSKVNKKASKRRKPV
ncbi:MAG: MmcQ/YjbR family DNA-binding protein [Myxococcaceae bacterium]|nr:MmcQ/YjbR family DNA-binding protein [Myxococcaceae bacterium]